MRYELIIYWSLAVALVQNPARERHLSHRASYHWSRIRWQRSRSASQGRRPQARVNGRKHHSNRLMRVFRKYGNNALGFEIVEIVEDKARLLEREQFHIDARKPVFNMAPKANSCAGVKHTQETCKKRAKATLAVWASMSEERKVARAKIPSANTKAQWMALSEEEKAAHRQKSRAGMMAYNQSLTEEEKAERDRKCKVGIVKYATQLSVDEKMAKGRRLLEAGNRWRAAAPQDVKAAMTAKMTATKRARTPEQIAQQVARFRETLARNPEIKRAQAAKHQAWHASLTPEQRAERAKKMRNARA